MTNSGIEAIQAYHEQTKHSLVRLQGERHFLDWEIRPRPFKIYPALEPIPLPSVRPESSVPALDAVAPPDEPEGRALVPNLRTLARLLHFSAGVTRTRVYPGGQEVQFRAAACTGALYHIDLYLVCGPLPDLEAGVYQFGPQDFALRRLRAGDFRGTVVEATAAEPAVSKAPAIIVCTSTFWRNAWKYRARAYRHCFWDNGTILANLLGVAAADHVPVRVVLGFADEPVNHLLGLDASREATLSLVAVGEESEARFEASPAVSRLDLETLPLSVREVDYPAIRAAHAASSLSPAEVAAWRGAARARELPVPAGRTVALPARPMPADSIDQVILRRGSAREFSPLLISLDQLAVLLRCAGATIPADCLDPGGGSGMVDVYLIVHRVEGLAPGAYVYHRRRHVIELLREGTFRREAGFLGLGQELPADASVNCYFLADLAPVLERFGNRGYRAAQLGAAIAGGRMYLAAYALGLGATGLTFFDDDVTEFFSPHAAGKSVMFLLAAGVAQRRT